MCDYITWNYEFDVLFFNSKTDISGWNFEDIFNKYVLPNHGSQDYTKYGWGYSSNWISQTATFRLHYGYSMYSDYVQDLEYNQGDMSPLGIEESFYSHMPVIANGSVTDVTLICDQVITFCDNTSYCEFNLKWQGLQNCDITTTKYPMNTSTTFDLEDLISSIEGYSVHGAIRIMILPIFICIFR